MKQVFFISPVRKATAEEKKTLESYVENLEAEGTRVYLPHRDTDQDDDIGYRICSDNIAAMKASDEIHMYYSPSSQGSIFDFGVTMALGKPFRLVNPEAVQRTPYKSFQNVILEVHDLYSKL
jgi:nucleoside 2-deoxyribosyltransferase